MDSAVDFVGAARLHVALHASDLERSTAFYRTLLGAEPSKVRPGYVKFEPAEPSVNLTLNESPSGRAAVSHFGVQVKTIAAVEAARRRFEAVGWPVEVEEQVDCCYAVQNKVWIADPDGNRWEVFVTTQADSSGRGGDAAGAACCSTEPLVAIGGSRAC